MAKLKYHNGTEFEVVDARYGEAITNGTLTITPSQIGNTSNLQTTDKTSLVNAINEVKAVAGDSLRNQMNENKRELAHLLAYAEIDGRALGNTGKFYHLMDGFNFVNSAATLDTFKAAIQGATSIGAATATLDTVTGLQVGMEVTLFDDVNLERPIIQAINTGTKVVTFASPLTKAFKDKATLCRSSVVIDTVNKLMKFGGWTYPITYSITSPTTIVASAYDTSGNGGRKLVRLSNGWLVAGVRNASDNVIYLYVSKDNGNSWTPLCNVPTYNADFSLVAIGNFVYGISVYANGVKSFFFNAVTQVNTALSVNLFEQGQITVGTCSLAYNNVNNCLEATWASKNSTYPNSFNIRYAKGTIDGNGNVSWGSVMQITVSNTTGNDFQNPSMVIDSAGEVYIFAQYKEGTNYYIFVLTNKYTTRDLTAAGMEATFGNKVVFNGSTYAQSNPCAVVKKYGSNIGRIFVAWHGLDSTDTTKQNIKIAYSDDGGANWTVIGKITSGNTVDRKNVTLAENTNGDVYAIYDDNGTITYQKCSNGTTTFGTTTVLDTGTNPSSIDGLDFSSPVMVFMSGSSVKFRGTWVGQANVPVLVEDVRYNITPPSGNIDEVVAWIQRQDDVGFAVDGQISIVASGANESYIGMTKTTSTIGASTKEDQFVGQVANPNSKATMRLTLTRTSTSINKGITKLLGAIS